VTDQDIETVEALLAAFRRGDVEAMLDLNQPDAEWVNPDYAIEPGTRRGREEIRRAIERIFEFFETVEVESMEPTPDGRILVIARVRSRGMGGGPGIEALTGNPVHGPGWAAGAVRVVSVAGGGEGGGWDLVAWSLVAGR